MPDADVIREQKQQYKGIYIGEVKNVNDPIKAGRIQVKLFGLFDHIEDKDLPWARPIMLPLGGSFGDIDLKDGEISRDCDTDIGSFMVPNLGAHVICLIPNENPNLVFYFGVIPGLKEYDTERFLHGDPHTQTETNEILDTECTFKPETVEGDFKIYPASPKRSRLHMPVWNKRTWPYFNKDLKFDMKSAYVEKIREETRVGVEKSYKTKWEEPHDNYKNSIYPKRKVLTFSERKILIEWDDTPGNETIHIFHPKGTFIEINNEGKLIIHSEDEEFEIVKNHKKISIHKNEIKTIREDKELRVKKDSLTTIERDRHVEVVRNDINRVQGDKIMRVHLNWDVKVCSNAYWEINGEWISYVGKRQELYAPITYIGAQGGSFGGVCTTRNRCRYTGGNHPGSSTVFASR